jgi:AcrR family transcriptional regulator
MSESTNVVPTRARLLLAAEQVLLESGYDRLSVRAVNAAAGMNPAAVHYHFGSKDALVAALLEERLGPLWEPRLTALAGRADPPSVAEVVDLVLGPLRELSTDPVGRLRLHLLAKFVLGRRVPAFTARWFALRPWTELLLAARPDLTERAARQRLALAFSLILQHFGDPVSDLPNSSEAPPGPVEPLRAFVVAGLDAPFDAPSEGP